MKKLAILNNHSTDDIIGTIDENFHFKFFDHVNINKKQLFNILGGAGVVITHMIKKDDEIIIQEGTILEWSIDHTFNDSKKSDYDDEQDWF